MTPFKDITDKALIILGDYRIDNYYKKDKLACQNYLNGFVVKAIPKFTNCIKSLNCSEVEVINEETLEPYNIMVIDSDLDMLEIDILSNLVKIEWFDRNTDDAKEINNHLQGRDKKSHAESSILKEKSERSDRLKEKVNQQMSDYEMVHFEHFIN